MNESLAEERLRLARWLRGLDPTDWAVPSLCAGWSCREVLAHLVTPFEASWPTVGLSMLRRGPAGAMDVWARALGERPIPELLASLERHAASTARPPGLPATAPLTDVLVHGLDIRWAITGPPPTVDHHDPGRVRACLEFLTSWRALGTFLPPGRLRAVRLVASDTEFSFGSGRTITGPALALAAGMLGRRPAYRLLHGDGLSSWTEAADSS